MPFIPLKDDNPHIRITFPYVVVGLIGTCVLVFIWQVSLSDIDNARAVFGLGFIPATIFDLGQRTGDIYFVPAELTFVTSLFLHADIMHLGGNMLFLWVFGDNIEDAMGHVKFAVFYLICGAAAGAAHGLLDPTSTVPLIGASGAISGVLGAYILLHPKARVLALLSIIVLRLPAGVLLLVWFGWQFLSLGQDSGPGGVAWWAHIGGFVAGALLIVPFRDRRLRLLDGLFGPPRTGPWG